MHGPCMASRPSEAMASLDGACCACCAAQVLDGTPIDAAEQAAANAKYAGRLTLDFLEEKLGHRMFDRIRDLDVSGIKASERPGPRALLQHSAGSEQDPRCCVAARVGAKRVVGGACWWWCAGSGRGRRVPARRAGEPAGAQPEQQHARRGVGCARARAARSAAPGRLGSGAPPGVARSGGSCCSVCLADAGVVLAEWLCVAQREAVQWDASFHTNQGQEGVLCLDWLCGAQAWRC